MLSKTTKKKTSSPKKTAGNIGVAFTVLSALLGNTEAVIGGAVGTAVNEAIPEGSKKEKSTPEVSTSYIDNGTPPSPLQLSGLFAVAGGTLGAAATAATFSPAIIITVAIASAVSFGGIGYVAGTFDQKNNLKPQTLTNG